MRSLYSDRPTWLHAVPAGAKLGGMVVLGALLAWADRPATLLPLVAGAAGLFLSVGRVPRQGWRPVLMVGAVALLIALFHALQGNAWLGMAGGLRLLAAMLLAVLLTLTTRFDQLLAVFEAVLAPLRPLGVRSERLALGLGLMLRFTEHFLVQWRRFDDAHRARTGRPGGWRLLSPLTVRMLVTAQRVADALQVRQRR